MTQEFCNRTELVLVKPDATRAEIQALCRHAIAEKFRAVCVNSSRVAEAFSILEDTEIKVISTISFPIGAADSDVKRYETEVAVDLGAQEFELVLNQGKIKDRDSAGLLREIRDVVDVAEERPVSILLPTKLLSRDEQVFVCELAAEGGAKFINSGTAEIETIQLLRETLGEKFSIKVGLSISDIERADELTKAGVTHFAAPFLAET
jgi:deoxyribose-phosphate aldolase